MIRSNTRPPWVVRLAIPILALAASAGSCRAPGETHGATGEAGGEPEEPAVAALRVDAEAARWAEETLAGLDLRQRVAQLVFPWISGQGRSAAPAEWQRMEAWARDGVGGLIVSTGTPQALAAKLNAAQAAAEVPLLVLSDLETGPGMRLRPGGTDMPPSMAFGAAGDADLAREAGRVTAVEARAVGIHMTLGPLFDVNSNPANPIINVRSFGEDPDLVGFLGTAWMEGARERGLLSAGKHFPGHGDTRIDSHVGLATIGSDSTRLFSVEIAPFARAVRAGIDGMLVGHLATVAIDGPGAPPASVSPRVVGEVLRGRLGFGGLAITDALNMGGVTRRYSVAEASIRALLAGADVLLQPPGHPGVIERIVEAVESGRIPAARINEAAGRVLRAKAAAGLHGGARVDPGELPASVAVPAHRDVARRVAERSITLVRDVPGVVPLRPGASVLHVTYTPTGTGGGGGGLQRALAAGGGRVDHVRVGPATTAATFARLRERAAAADVVVASAVVAPFQYRALGLEGGFGPWVESISAAGRPVIAVSLGSPYLLDAFPSVPAYLLAWGTGAESEAAAAAALRGRAPITGRLPVSLPPHHRRGEGIERGGP
jgi:beta-N-acetylhexosaminidase